VLSAITRRGGEMTLRALELGAFDFLTKPDAGTPSQNIAALRQQLIPMIRAFERRREIRKMLDGGSPRAARSESILPVPRAPANPERSALAMPRSGSPMVLIGVSTGGPVALATLLPKLPANLGAPVFIVQHMPAMFTRPLAVSLDRKCAIRVNEAEDGEPAQINHAYVAPGGRHMKLVAGPKREILIRLTDDQPENGCRPAVDYLFRSAALQFRGRAVAAILTGMGNDGTAGLRMLKRSGCVAIAQDEATSVVFGMPKEAIAAGVVDTVAPLDQIAGVIVRSLREPAA
jgi:two-component system chemotaxis response regulator CheB